MTGGADLAEAWQNSAARVRRLKAALNKVGLAAEQRKRIKAALAAERQKQQSMPGPANN